MTIRGSREGLSIRRRYEPVDRGPAAAPRRRVLSSATDLAAGNDVSPLLVRVATHDDKAAGEAAARQIQTRVRRLFGQLPPEQAAAPIGALKALIRPAGRAGAADPCDNRKFGR